LPGQPPAVPSAVTAPPAFSAPEPPPFMAPEPTPFVAPPAPSVPPPRPPVPPLPFAAATKTAKPAEGDDPDRAHFSQVFEEYLALRQKCGESVVGLSLDKFTAKLQSNRDQLVSKHGCKRAQFTVYEKDGKAAIRAVPVRD